MYANDENPGRRSQAERRAATRRALLDAARGLFAERGYHEAAAEEIVRRAGVTRGALYHHFEDKRGLFRAVVEEIEAEVDEAVLEAARGAMREGAAHAVAQVAAGLELLMDGGVIERRPVGPLAHLLHGATTEAAMYVAFAEDRGRARDEVGGALRRLLEGL